MTGLPWQESNCMQERGTWWRGRSRARGWQWQGRLLQGVVVVASWRLLPQEGHQVAKLEHANASRKLQCGLPCCNLLAAALHFLLNAFMHSCCSEISRWCTCNKLVQFSTWSTGHQLALKFYTLQSWAKNLLKEASHHITTISTLNGVVAIINCSKPLLSLTTLLWI
jgi:hypothetical protein